jgi:eukaryotic-like serine/threonine-protein kinase
MSRVPTPEDEPTADAGRLIAGRYRLESKLGGGAMGTVWSGTDELLRRPVAVKEVRLPPDLPEDEAAELRERALREARAIAVVTHPNVVTLYDVAREDGEPFVVMELVPSQSLATIIHEHGVLDDHQLAVITDGVAAGLEAAHRNGIIHRDVKPGNVLIGDAGRVKLSDFGISRNVAEPTITRTGIMLGTPAFIAPEIASGDDVTISADLWGLGATLFAASEGHAPYDSDGEPLATITSVVRGPVPVPSRTGPIGDVITGLMTKDPAQRMSLPEVRRHVRHLLTAAGARPFEMLLDPEAPTVRVRKPAQTPSTREDSQPASEPAPLANDPGPLPFIPQESAPPRRTRWPAIVLGISAVLVFTLATAGSFAASRFLAGHQALPATTPKPPPEQPLTLIPYNDSAQHTSDSGKGNFAVLAPQDWTVFHSERDDVTYSKTVSFVSSDGRSQVSVERFGGFYRDGYTTDRYLKTLPELAAGSPERFTRTTDVPVGGTDKVSGDTDRHLAYIVTDTGVTGSSAPPLRRNTVAQLMPRNGDLWLLRVTVPSTEEARGAKLFDAVLQGFTVQP